MVKFGLAWRGDIMKILDINGNLIKPRMSKGRIGLSKGKKATMDLVNKHSLLAVEGKGQPIRLQEIKNNFKELKGNPLNMNMEAGHANAKVRNWGLQLRVKGFPVKVDDKVEVHHIDALEFGDAVIYVNFQLIRHHITKQKDKKVKAEMQKRLEALKSIPRRDSYYK
jgi:hypothetical protein